MLPTISPELQAKEETTGEAVTKVPKQSQAIETVKQHEEMFR